MSRVTPLGYARDNGHYVVVAGNMGAPAHPGWYHNLCAKPEVTIEVGAQRLPARVRVADGADRDRLWELMQDRAGLSLDEFQIRAGRRIPVVVLGPRTSTQA